MRELRGAYRINRDGVKEDRYIVGASPSFCAILADQLPYFSFYEAMSFYKDFNNKLNNNELALLGCNDRFFLLTGLLNRVDAIHPWIYDRAREVEADPDGHLDLWARYHYKDLCQSIQVLTTSGWKAHGALEVGDFVYGVDGMPTRVVGTKHFTDSTCYRLTFCNGVQITAGAHHLWQIEAPSRKRVPGSFVKGETHGKRITRETRVVSTAELQAMVAKGGYSPGIRIAKPLQGAERELAIDPYLLGAWLGDGYTDHGAVCGIDDEVFDEIERRGWLLKPRQKNDETRHPNFRIHTVTGLTKALRAGGLLGNKHIPAEYLTASESQRRDLLWGLIDTDGSVSTASKNACVTFASSIHAFAAQVRTLANSLGYKARLTPARTTNSWHVTFIAYADDPHPPCFLSRKRALLKIGAGKRETRRRALLWRVVLVEPVETVPTNCIQVDNADGMYLAGPELVPTHNSSAITFAGTVQEIMCDPETRVAIFSNTKAIAHPFIKQIKEEFESNEILKDVYCDVLWGNPSSDAPTWSINEGLTVKRQGNPRECTVEGHGVMDAMPTGKHFPLLVYDDIITEKNVTNKPQLTKATERTELSFNCGIGEKTRKWFIGTRYHYADSYGHLLEKKIASPRLYPATDDGTIDGNPVFMTAEAWAKVLREQRSNIAAQMLQNPIAGKENTFLTKWLKPYWIRPIMMNVYIMGDPSAGRSATSDRTAIAVVGIDSNDNKYLLDGYCHRMKQSERWDNLYAMWRKWSNTPGVQLVKVGYERYGMQEDIEHFQKKMREIGKVFDILELNWTGDAATHAKTKRVGRLEPDFRGGSFFVPGKVWHNLMVDAEGNPVAGSIARWSILDPTVNEEQKALYEKNGEEFYYQPMNFVHKDERRALQAGERWRTFDALRRIDEDGNIYDLTRTFFEEFRFFPFAPHDDLIDAMARIYDMEPMPAVRFETVEVEDFQDA